MNYKNSRAIKEFFVQFSNNFFEDKDDAMLLNNSLNEYLKLSSPEIFDKLKETEEVVKEKLLWVMRTCENQQIRIRALTLFLIRNYFGTLLWHFTFQFADTLIKVIDLISNGSKSERHLIPGLCADIFNLSAMLTQTWHYYSQMNLITNLDQEHPIWEEFRDADQSEFKTAIKNAVLKKFNVDQMPVASGWICNIPELDLAPEPEQSPIIGRVGKLDSGNSGVTAPLDPGQSTPAWSPRIDIEGNLDSADTAPPRSGQPTSVCPLIFCKGETLDTDDSFGIESHSAPEPEQPTCLSMIGSEFDEPLGITIPSVPTRDDSDRGCSDASEPRNDA